MRRGPETTKYSPTAEFVSDLQNRRFYAVLTRVSECSLIDSMELGLSSGADSCAVSQELANILWNPIVYYRVPYPEPDQSSPYHSTPFL
jgi:hypothetical protein